MNRVLLLRIFEGTSLESRVWSATVQLNHEDDAIYRAVQSLLSDTQSMLSGGEGKGGERICRTYVRALHRTL